MSASSHSSAVLAEQPDAVAGRDAGVDQGGGAGQGVVVVVGPGEVVVQAVPLEAHGGPRPEALGLAAVQLGEVPVGHHRSSARTLPRIPAGRLSLPTVQ